MLAGTLVYVNAGTQLARIESLAGILSPGCWAPSCCSACSRCWPRRSSTPWQARKVYAGWPKPARFDRNLVVIGAGAGGWSPPTSPPR
jgi:hypothetical protein